MNRRQLFKGIASLAVTPIVVKLAPLAIEEREWLLDEPVGVPFADILKANRLMLPPHGCMTLTDLANAVVEFGGTGLVQTIGIMAFSVRMPIDSNFKAMEEWIYQNKPMGILIELKPLSKEDNVKEGECWVEYDG